MVAAERRLDVAATRGRPSAWWRYGQDRRFAWIESYAALRGSVALDLGCGVGRYTARMAAAGATALGLEIELDRAAAARSDGVPVAAGVGEALPLGAASMDVVLLHEVLEHVADDRATLREVARVLRPGGRCLVFVPNRLWPFETHGVLWGGRYRFGNAPLVNYLPDPLRNRLAPHVRVYTRASLRRLAVGLPLREIALRGIFPGYDKLSAERPAVGRLLRRLSDAAEQGPLQRFALSHFAVWERM
jgi:SAM-dependent methyltransferase